LARFLLYNLQYNLKLLENSMKLKKQTGFTLVEIAIVLVIVGLLIGGVLKGQEMITNAKLKRMESDNAGVAAAMFSYQDRYLQLPGDDSKATGRFDFYTDATPGGAGFTVASGTTAGEADGDGDGLIGDGDDWDVLDPNNVMVTASKEASKFWGHLRASGLVPGGNGADTTRPANAYGGLMGIQDGSMDIVGHVIIFGGIEGGIARIVEARLDDGNPKFGRIQANVSGVTMAGSATNSSASTAYEEDKRYDMAFRL
jgi:prepilin-type N-terminal cleavage/methylation domain-containing protein